MQYSTLDHNVNSAPLKRCADRFTAELLVEIDGVQGLTRNISATGMYLEVENDQTPDSRIHFTVEVTVQGQQMKLNCDGEVIRVDHKARSTGIAVRLDTSFFSDI